MGYRELFERRARDRAALVARPRPVSGETNIVVHIRRGDQLKYGRKNSAYVTQRYVPNVAFTSLLKGLVASLAPRRVRVLVLCEGAKPGGLVPDVDGTLTDFTEAVGAPVAKEE